VSSNTEVDLLHLVTDLTTIADDAQLTFGNLTAQQLNWKPSTEVWSIGQCFV
jgi:hypothetical protein